MHWVGKATALTDHDQDMPRCGHLALPEQWGGGWAQEGGTAQVAVPRNVHPVTVQLSGGDSQGLSSGREISGVQLLRQRPPKTREKGASVQLLPKEKAAALPPPRPPVFLFLKEEVLCHKGLFLLSHSFSV